MFFLKALIVSVLIVIDVVLETSAVPLQETLQGRSTDLPPQDIERRATSNEQRNHGSVNHKWNLENSMICCLVTPQVILTLSHVYCDDHFSCSNRRIGIKLELLAMGVSNLSMTSPAPMMICYKRFITFFLLHVAVGHRSQSIVKNHHFLFFIIFLVYL
ncbi:hypothetical protein DFH28DRAFT_948442 [Melampsora americana]|nr:hypothetical protein DFH28DRAFT_948442 [Melampsora americana]